MTDKYFGGTNRLSASMHLWGGFLVSSCIQDSEFCISQNFTMLILMPPNCLSKHFSNNKHTFTRLIPSIGGSYPDFSIFVILSRFCFCFCYQAFAIGSVKLLSKPNQKYGLLWKTSFLFQYQISCVSKQQQHNQLLNLVYENVVQSFWPAKQRLKCSFDVKFALTANSKVLPCCFAHRAESRLFWQVTNQNSDGALPPLSQNNDNHFGQMLPNSTRWNFAKFDTRSYYY